MKCSNCEKALFDIVWCEYKCSVHKRVATDAEIVNCEYYKNGTPKESKRTREDYLK